jgi:hypothetical protein
MDVVVDTKESIEVNKFGIVLKDTVNVIYLVHNICR